MKRLRTAWIGSFALMLVGALIFVGCEGPAGADGADGQDGAAGKDGIDANATCIQCHDDNQLIIAVSKQYSFSGHATGHTSGYCNRSFGPTYNCAGCHTSQGFLDNLLGESNVPYANVTQPNCYTCHNIHETYTSADWALTNPNVVQPLSGSEGVDLGTGNQCVSCHQSVGQYINNETLFAGWDDGGQTSLELTSSELRVGVHHAPQYNILTGMDLFEFSGDTDYPTGNHVLMKAEDGCVTCHMNDGFGDLTGHSMSMTYSFHGPQYNWPESCMVCHEEDGDKDLADIVKAIDAETTVLLDSLYNILVAEGIMYPSDGSNAYLVIPGTFTSDLLAAHVNFNAIREDRSMGFHNPGYIEAVLENTIGAISAK